MSRASRDAGGDIPIFWDDRQLLHAPKTELSEGSLVAYAEQPARAQCILDALMAGQIGMIQPPGPLDEALLRRVHDDDYIALVRGAWDDWCREGRGGDAMAGCWPVRGRRDLIPSRVQARLGAACFDAGTPITAHTRAAAEAAAAIGQATGAALARGARLAFGLCRPPGHHAGRDYMGGYCYFNNAALAAEHLLAAGAARVGVLDVDYHHGNGTQDIFYARGEVFFASIHCDPATDFPYFWGSADERGVGPGEGANLNLPLPRGSAWAGYAPALEAALFALQRFQPQALVISFGADTFEADPISHFKLKTGDYQQMGAAIARLGLPMAVIMEGGYCLEALGANVRHFLEGLSG